MSIELEKNRLCPFVVIRLCCTERSTSIISESKLFKLFDVCRDIFVRNVLWFHFVIDRVLFCTESKCVESHRVEYIESFEHLFASETVRSYVSLRMSYVKSCSGWIGKHVQNVVFWLIVFLYFVEIAVFSDLLSFFSDVLKIHICLVNG